MSMGLNWSALRVFSIARRTSSVASVQISTSFWRRSPSVMMPRRNWFSTLSASFSWRSRISFFSGGVCTSSIETVRPDLVAKRKHRFLMASRLEATSALS